jgi:hypothetical protein
VPNIDSVALLAVNDQRKRPFSDEIWWFSIKYREIAPSLDKTTSSGGGNNRFGGVKYPNLPI